jgi:hypothetical protein
MSFLANIFGQPLNEQVAAAKAKVVAAEKALQTAKANVYTLETKIATQQRPTAKANSPVTPAPVTPPSEPMQEMQEMQQTPTAVGGKRNRKSRNNRNKSKKSRDRRQSRSRSRSN